MPDLMRCDWENKINHSAIELAAKVISSKNEDERNINRIRDYSLISGIVAAVIMLLFFWVNGMDVRNWVDSRWDYMLQVLWIASASTYIHWAKKDYQPSYEKHRQMLMKRIQMGFCHCSDTCHHREEFMAYMDKKYGIRLYY